MHEVRPNIYVDVELRGVEVPSRVVAIVAVALVLLILLVLFVFFVCRFLLKVQHTQLECVQNDPTSTETSQFPPPTGNADLWRKTFLGIVCDNKKYVHNLETLHAIYAVPLDLRLCDALVNEELFKEKDSLSRAWERRRALNDVFGVSVHDANGGTEHGGALVQLEQPRSV
ncbi:hypothetical protein TraAM80_03220 [Trypanosoma rangeli]|uniref:Uncharacterized protein n=1 Tax=Trypanosoma rangeli TaxID=5698 RepID=A0A3R7NU22_TRYRA|nr:uncharacterized protein TraAM80_03220 [Trypanosoma rangeli]RNF07698.1 hypothetical protein TraAM80_03220 [Trypanosoma rangeli]|eukprot:RNF07698.1 hypothetical protein TraAM80_03220 [Trypanosoma rangeli]